MTDILDKILVYWHASPVLRETVFWLGIILFLMLYRLIRKGRWQNILGCSLDYHRYHLGMLAADRDADEKNRSLYQALLWAVNKQLPDDLKRARGRGGMVLFMSFAGEKTCVNTCGTVFYESAKNYSFINRSVVKLNDTLMSTFYRILLLESVLAPVSLIYMDFRLLVSIITKPETGAGRLYREMISDLKNTNHGE